MPYKLVVTGSNPVWGTLIPSSSVVERVYKKEVPARLAQLVERQTFNLVVVGSNPTVGTKVAT